MSEMIKQLEQKQAFSLTKKQRKCINNNKPLIRYDIKESNKKEEIKNDN